VLIVVLLYVFLCCSMYRLFCDVRCFVCVYMCTEQLPPGGYPIAVKYIISYIISYNINHIISYHIISYHINHTIWYMISYQSYNIIPSYQSYNINHTLWYDIISYQHLWVISVERVSCDRSGAENLKVAPWFKKCTFLWLILLRSRKLNECKIIRVFWGICL
jgi:hypothetical protein